MNSQIDIFQPDDLDIALLRLLEADSRLPTVTLAKRLGVSRTTVQARLERLVSRGVITAFTIRLDEDYLARRIQGHVAITIAPKAARQVETRLKAMPQVRQLYAVSGPFDMIAVVSTESIAEMNIVIDDIGAVEGVERTNSSIILSQRLAR
ncbi:Lrp/AsnC family transcriptional regulator [Nitrospirillum sp. BR 11163]|uniref:Lrp/AsnC family transcriptional regulator n=1 Tax=Nitrospirillum sp. BR 11163 TaxID=3104323 RepID=UPI002AFDFBA0|nr:Lrp/AsnC family transcriptional regulator [Nitrospirillum sp. BR 11163]MEA1676420.1 Lrp/AsnC family transcriptional regulator [Nitrospirillum sp. BR 11163]